MGERALQRVAFGPGFLRRVELFAPRCAALRERREGAGGAHLAGAGLEFVGRRPYRAGDDPRRIDWELLAREDQPYVRVLHREAVEHWAIVLDTSASMDVGSPSKLQSAAEVAVALAAVGVRARATVTLHFTGPRERSPAHHEAEGGRAHEAATPRSVTLRRPGDVARAAAACAALPLERHDVGLTTAARRGAVPAEAAQVFLLGDLFDAAVGDGVALGIAPYARPGRALVVGRVLADSELEPEGLGAAAARFIDPESGAALSTALDAATLAAYRAALEQHLERTSQALERRRVRHHLWRASAAFEVPARALLEG